MTVEVEPERVEQAMRKAAGRLSKKSRIPGFRPGKAPYNLVLSMFGREYVLGEALEDIGNAIYKEALEASGIEPFAMGTLHDVQEEGRKLVFVVPKRPTVELGDYRSLRVEHEPAEITDEAVTRAMEALREGQALLEPVERAAKLTDLVTFEHILISVLGADGEALDVEHDEDGEDDLDEDVEDDGDDDEDEEDDEDDLDQDEDDGDDDEDDDDEEDDDGDEDDEDDEEDLSGPRMLFHEHQFDRVLREDNEDFFPGFSAQIVGLSPGNTKEFDLVMPAEFPTDESIAGRTLRFDTHLAQVQARTLPDWSDELAERISEGEQKTMVELRLDVRKRLEAEADRVARQSAASEALDRLLESASIHYPEELVQDYITDLLADLETNVLSQQGLTLKDFMRVTGQTEEALRVRYREPAEQRAKRALVLGEIVRQENISIKDEDVDAEIERMSALMGEQAANFRAFLTRPQNRFNIGMDLTTNRAIDRLAAIVRGENPSLEPAPALAEETMPAVQEPGEPTTDE